MPLCARCAGIHLGILCAVIYLAVRRRLFAGEFPPRAALFCLMVPAALTAADALPKLFGGPEYTSNAHRLALGAALGAAVVLSASPACSRLFCRAPRRVPTVVTAGEAALVVGVSALVSNIAGRFGGNVALAAGCMGVCVAMAVATLTNLAIIRALMPGLSQMRAAVSIAVGLTAVQALCASAAHAWLLSVV